MTAMPTASASCLLGLGRHFNINDSLKPWAQIHAGYTYQDIEQNRRDYMNILNNSSPSADVFSVGALLSNEFNPKGHISLTPRLGLDYTHMQLDDYTEKGGYMGYSGPLRLNVDPDAFDSLALNLGAALDWRFEPGMKLQGRAYYYYEFLDTDVDFNNRAPTLPGHMFATQGQDLNGHSAQLGLGLELNPMERLSLGLNYDLWLADHYVGHQVDVSFKIAF